MLLNLLSIMFANNVKYFFEDKSRRIFSLAFLLSLLSHLILLFFIKHYDLIKIDLTDEEDKLLEDLTIIFPENKPKHVVENINENNEIPEQSDLLSDYNSRARNRELLANRLNQPSSDGNLAFGDLTRKNILSSLYKNAPQKKFSMDALQGDQGVFQSQKGSYQETINKTPSAAAEQQSTGNIWEQKKFSADQLGNISLSTYAWEWAPYINSLKNKLHQVWLTPPAYHMLGIIYGQTKLVFVISKNGELLDYKVLEHQGHESLKIASVNAIKSCFPFKSLPANFPEETLTITALLIYPNLREERN